MRLIVGIILGVLLMGVVAGFIAWSGSYNVAALNSPGRLETRVATYTLRRAIARRAPATANPFKKPEDVRDGLAHFKENCVDCHGAPGVEESEFGMGLNPPAPDLTLPAIQRMTDGELYWVIANGIRMTGMPAFSLTHKQDEIWKIVSFVRHMPEITKEEQQVLRAAREKEEAGHHEASEAGGTAEKEGGKNGGDKEPGQAPSAPATPRPN
jgi:mono/diheme cytochrome c family protein